MDENFVFDLSRDGCLKFLSSTHAAQHWKANQLSYIKKHAEHLIKEILPDFRKNKTDFVSVEGLGGEAVLIRSFDKLCQRETIFKIAFPDANLQGTRTVYQAENPRNTRVEHFNIIRERFIRGGAQIAGALSDMINRKYGCIPHIRTACDFPVYVEMELLDGKNPLHYYNKLEFHQIFEYFYRLLVLVSVVHSFHVIHRDFKPSNLLVIEDEDGLKPAILDWTFAKQMNVNGEETGICDLTQASNMNFHIHSPCFSSPRLIEGGGEHADYQDDIYSLGQIMYCLFTRTLPKNLKDFITRVTPKEVNGMLLPSTALPEEVIEIYRKATHIDEAQRYKTVNDFLVDLEGFAGKIDIVFPPIYVPDLYQKTPKLEEFTGTLNVEKQTPTKKTDRAKTQPIRVETKVKRKLAVIDLSQIENETARKIVKNIVKIAIKASKYNIVLQGDD